MRGKEYENWDHDLYAWAYLCPVKYATRWSKAELVLILQAQCTRKVAR
jgi:hypothetical protein